MSKLLYILVIDLFLTAIILPQADSITSIRFMTYNIHHGEGIDSVIDISRISKLILENEIDIATLQEVDRGVLRTGRIDIPGLFSAQTDMNYSFYKNINYQGGEYGNCILSKFPILKDTNLHYTMLREGEQRGLLQTVINIEGICITVMNTHLDYREDDSERVSNVVQIFEVMENYLGLPLIIAGDFNDDPESRIHLQMKEKFIDVWEYLNDEPGLTYPTENPNKRIDYIFIKKQNEQKEEVRMIPTKIFVLESIASDHLPVIVEFEISNRNQTN
jgi:endonuclease/exonuclease/phosphatase family metal-dependent hydrolase